jgi:hypothetical protein
MQLDVNSYQISNWLSPEVAGHGDYQRSFFNDDYTLCLSAIAYVEGIRDFEPRLVLTQLTDEKLGHAKRTRNSKAYFLSSQNKNKMYAFCFCIVCCFFELKFNFLLVSLYSPRDSLAS